MQEYPYFPLFVDLSRKTVVVVGGGAIAKRRICTLMAFTPNITVIAPAIHPELEPLVAQGRIQYQARTYRPADLERAGLVLAATGDAQCNQEIVRHCRARGIPVNTASDHTQCDFFFPGVVRQENVVVGVTASGKDHHQAREVTEQIRQWLSPDQGESEKG